MLSSEIQGFGGGSSRRRAHELVFLRRVARRETCFQRQTPNMASLLRQQCNHDKSSNVVVSMRRVELEETVCGVRNCLAFIGICTVLVFAMCVIFVVKQRRISAHVAYGTLETLASRSTTDRCPQVFHEISHFQKHATQTRELLDLHGRGTTLNA